MRLLHYMGVASGNPQQAVEEANKLFRASEDQIRTAVDNIDDAMKFISESKESPTRIGICQTSTGVDGGFLSHSLEPGMGLSTSNQNGQNQFGLSFQTQAPSSFGVSSQPGTTSQFGAPSQPGPLNRFGAPSVIGQNPNPFAPANSKPSESPFGAYSTSTNAFNSAQATPSNPFNVPSQPPANIPGNPFGAPSEQFSTPSNNPAFLGLNTQKPPIPFGAPSVTPANPFQSSGATSTPFDTPAAIANPFQTGAKSPNPFGAPTALANPFQTNNKPATVFGAPSASVNPFQTSQAQPTPPSANFSQTSQSNISAHLSTEPNHNPFQAQKASQVVNPFQASSSIQLGNPFATTVNTVGNHSNGPQPAVGGLSKPESTGSWKKQADLASYSTKNENGKGLSTFKGRRVVYRADEPGFEIGGRWLRIWCPKGIPSQAAGTELDPASYNDKDVEAAYMHLHDYGVFQGGIMPQVPPKIAWCKFDF